MSEFFVSVSERERNLLSVICFLIAIIILLSVLYWNTDDDYSNGYREGYCIAKGAEFKAPNLCMNGEDVVSVWAE